MSDYPVRKNLRLKTWDYTSGGTYFLTFCTKGHRCILSAISSPANRLMDLPCLHLLPAGEIVDRQIHGLEATYPWLRLHHYAIMPNHVHLLVEIVSGADGASRTPPPTDVGAGLPDRPPCRADQRIPALISTLKRFTNRAAGCTLWQRSYHDHIVRNTDDFQTIWTYIDQNPQKWELDRYYTDTEKERPPCRPS